MITIQYYGAFIKLQIGEDPDYDRVIARYKAEVLGDNSWSQDMWIVPVDFNTEHKAMLGYCKMILENEGDRIANYLITLTDSVLIIHLICISCCCW